jgi:DNA-binding CsgD family transcriptional regulator
MNWARPITSGRTIKAMMDAQIVDSYSLTDSREVELWKNSIFVFDTSALLQFYYYSDSAKNNIFDTTFEALKGRLWIPFHVRFEYSKNRVSTINKSYSEKYDPLEKDSLQGIQRIIDSISPKLDDFQTKTKSTDIHPFIDSAIIAEFKTRLDDFRRNFQEFDGKVRQQFEARKTEINSMSSNDIVLTAIEKYFDRGESYNFTEIMEIVTEGEIRYRNEIPPGYKDAKGKEGTQKYGDLIIWKQIIDRAKVTKKPIIFVTNDVKIDWVYVIEQGSEKRIERPREDLIKEIEDHANVGFWMYTFSQFLYTARKRLNTQIDKKVLEEVEKVNITKQSDMEVSRSPLSPREMEILTNVTRGLSNKEIATSLGISQQTVKNHMTAILFKLGLEDRTQAAVHALRQGWVPLQEDEGEE